MLAMNRSVLVVLFVLTGCAHTAHVKGIDSNPSAHIDTATFTHIANDVVVDVQVNLGPKEEKFAPQILVRTQIPCREGPVPPPPGFRMVYVSFNPTTLSTLTVTEGFITVHKCDGKVLEFSGGWYVEGIIATALELPFQPPNPPVPVTHIELTHVNATLIEQSAEAERLR